MSTTAQAYGLIPVAHPTGQNRASQYTIASGYATALYKGDLVAMGTDGTIVVGGGAGVASLGVFAGCEYVDATGKPTVSAYWPASTTATNIKAYVYDDPATMYKISTAGGTPSGYVQTAVGGQCDYTAVAGSANTGVSAGYAAAVQAGAVGNLRVLGFVNGEIYNATTNPYPEILVQINELQMVAGGTALA